MRKSSQQVPSILRWFAPAALSAVLILACGGGQTTSGLTEASTNFDLENVKPFLLRLSTHVDGFGAAQIDPLVEDIAAMSVDAEKSWEFDVVHDGERTPLHIRVSMDDVEAPEVYFFTSAKLAATIKHEMETYFDELGM